MGGLRSVPSASIFMSELMLVFLGLNLALLLMNLLTVWMNVKLLTENTKHRLLEK